MFAIFTLLSILGCPLPSDDITQKIPTLQNNGGLQQGKGGAKGTVAKGGPPPVRLGKPGKTESGEKPSGAPGGVLLDMGQMIAQKTQEEIATQDHVKISGKITGECGGTLRLDIILTESLGGPKEGEMKGPITTVSIEKVGDFSVLVPKSASVNLTALCDEDDNQKITADIDQLSLGARLGVVDDDVSDVTLTLEEIKPPNAENAPKVKEQ